MKLKIVTALLTASVMMMGCHNDDHDSTDTNTTDNNTTDTNTTDTTDTNTTAGRFSTISISGDTIRIDGTTNLQWIGSKGDGYKSTAAATTEVEDIATATAYCDTVTFANYKDWRVASSSEVSAFVKAMESEKLTPYYADTSAVRLIGVDTNASKAINTHNTSPTGNISTWTTLLASSTTSYVTKCVRP
jgi:PBP1b-binding outer membrane lipoprotein LpoB